MGPRTAFDVPIQMQARDKPVRASLDDKREGRICVGVGAPLWRRNA